MIRFVRDIRLVPIVLFATISLFALKTIGLVADGRYALADLIGGDAADITGTVPDPPAAEPAKRAGKPSWAQEVFGFPDVTGALDEKKAEASPPPAGKPETKSESKPEGKPQEPPKSPTGWTPVPLDTGRRSSPAEQAILERLQERRAELETRARELEMRESLIKAAEKRVEGRVSELKDLETRVNTAAQQRDENEAARFKNLVTMYENMKAKEAAKIFDRLDIKILVEVATQINPRRMSDILAQMSPESAERLTVELAARATGKDKGAAAMLPKIEGKPSE